VALIRRRRRLDSPGVELGADDATPDGIHLLAGTVAALEAEQKRFFFSIYRLIFFSIYPIYRLNFFAIYPI
jgi:hypothetical protein